jgi:CBS domain-containing protein
MKQAMERLESLTVRDVMNHHVVTIASNRLMVEAAQLLQEREISGLPVVDEQGRCVGVLSVADFVRCTTGLSASDSSQAKVAQHMSSAVQTIHADRRLLEAAEIMGAQHIHRIPVLDDDQRPIGIITSMDVVCSLLNAVDEERQSQY